MSNTSVISVKINNLKKLGYNSFEHWSQDKNNIYIGRNMNFYVKGAIASKWKNPYSVKKYGINESLKLYEEYLLNNKELLNDINELKGKTLGCWCKNNGDEPCHGDILVKLINKK